MDFIFKLGVQCCNSFQPSVQGGEENGLLIFLQGAFNVVQFTEKDVIKTHTGILLQFLNRLFRINPTITSSSRLDYGVDIWKERQKCVKRVTLSSISRKKQTYQFFGESNGSNSPNASKSQRWHFQRNQWIETTHVLFLESFL